MPRVWTGAKKQQKCSVCGGIGHKANSHIEKIKHACAVEGCGKPVRSIGLCQAHYLRKRKHGDPTAGGTEKGALQEWVAAHVDFSGGECLIWPFGDSGNGYGRIMRDGKPDRAHRVMCEMRHGPAPLPDMEAAHSCGNGHIGCVNPNHLRWATRGENQSDKYLHKRLKIGRHSETIDTGRLKG